MGIFGSIFGKENGPEARAFVMSASEMFSIPGRGTLVTGKVQAGEIESGDTVHFKSSDGKPRAVKVEVEIVREDYPGRTKAAAGMNVGLFLRGVGAEEVAAGTVITGTPQ